jgi:hypothetical protein
MYILYVCTSTLYLLLCTPLIVDEELYRWIVELKRPLLHCLIVMIYALPLQSFPYLIFLSIEFKEILALIAVDFFQRLFANR